jgi:hypothetical protein
VGAAAGRAAGAATSEPAEDADSAVPRPGGAALTGAGSPSR